MVQIAQARKITTQNVRPKIITFNRDNCRNRNNHHHDLISVEKHYVRQWKIADGNLEGVGSFYASYAINAIAASMDGQWIVTGDAANTVTVWGAFNRAVVRQISEHTGHVSAVDVSSNSTQIASGSADSTVRIFNLISGIRLVPPLVPENSVTPTDVKFSPDGSRVAAATPSLVCVYDARSGNKLLDFAIQSIPFSSFAWSFDSQQLFVSSPGKMSRFDTSTSSRFESQWPINDTDNGNTASVVIHGRFVACATGLRVLFWDYTLGKQIGDVVNNATAVDQIAISPDGKYLACRDQQGITLYHLADILPWDYFHISRFPRIPLVQLDDQVLTAWKLGNLKDAQSVLSGEIHKAPQGCDPKYRAHMLAVRSIVQARLKEWKAATGDAEMSLQIKQSPMGQIARFLALVGAGGREVALDDFELAFRDCDLCDTTLLLVIKSILSFMCGKHKQAVSRLQHLIATADETTKSHYIPVLGNMYLKQGDYENAVQTLVLAKNPSTSRDSDPLMTITLIFGWNFDRIWESLYFSKSLWRVREILLNIVSELPRSDKEYVHGRILEELVTRSGQVDLLLWTGKPSTCNSCLPGSPELYSGCSFDPPQLDPAELEKRTDELRAVVSFADALAFYIQATRFQPVRFAHFRLLLPCIVYEVKGLRHMLQHNTTHIAETAEFGDVYFTTADSLPFKEPQRLVFADLRIHSLRLESDTERNPENGVPSADAELIHAPMIEEVPPGPQLDEYTRALRLIARLGQRFSALLLLRQSDGSYKRVATEQRIVVNETQAGKNNVPKGIRVEVLEIL